MPDLPLQGRVALVAGASRGIGAATAEAFAAAGAAVVLGARDRQALDSVAQRIESAGGRAIAVRADVADVDSMRNLISRGLAAFGRAGRGVQQRHRRPAAGPARRHRSGRVRPRHRHQHPRHFPRPEVPDPGDAARRRRRDREHGLGRRAHRHRQPRGLRGRQGRDHRADQGRRAGLRRPGYPGQRRGAGPDPDPPPAGHAARRPGGWPGCPRRCGAPAPPRRWRRPCCGCAPASPRSSPGT